MAIVEPGIVNALDEVRVKSGDGFMRMSTTGTATIEMAMRDDPTNWLGDPDGANLIASAGVKIVGPLHRGDLVRFAAGATGTLTIREVAGG